MRHPDDIADEMAYACGPRNEYAAAFEVSNLRHSAANMLPPIPPGMFAVVCEAIAYCPITDATLHSPHRELKGIYGSRRVAEYHRDKIEEELYEAKGEAWAYVLPKLPAKEPEPLDFDDIPF
jgi:hypothetical protein